MPLIKDYYEPWNYNYEHLTTAKSGNHSPVARAYSEITGDNIEIEWGPKLGKMTWLVVTLQVQKILTSKNRRRY